MENEIKFMAVGGAQEVGASCYYLGLGGVHFLLDCGSGRTGWVNFAPKFDLLKEVPGLYDFRQISQVIISHAHLDHVGALPDFLRLSNRATVYMTDFTWQVLKLQFGGEFQAAAQEKILRVSFLQEIPLGNLSVSFHKAGHIPGAMMTLFKFGGRNILYTGDYSVAKTQLVSEAALPEEKIDVLILCGMHARHPFYRANDGIFENILRQIRHALDGGRVAYCRVNQITKGVELLALLNKFLPDAEIFFDRQVMKVVGVFEDLQIKVLTARNRSMDYFSYEPCVIISTQAPPRSYRCEVISCDFSLHDDFEAAADFVRRVNPETCIVVHSPHFSSRTTIARALLDCRTSFIFPESGEIFNI